MSSIFPIRSDPSPGGQDPRVVDLEGEDADAVFGALSSDTAREVVAALHDEPCTQSEIAEELDTTVQNVRYHLDNLEEAGLVEIVDTWYSSRGNEMKVYAPADGALIVSGDHGEASRLKTALSRLVGGAGVIGLASLLLQSISERLSTAGGSTVDGAASGGAGGGGGDGGEDAAGGGGGDGGEDAAGGVAADGGDAAYDGDGGDGARETTTEIMQEAPEGSTETAEATRTITRTATRTADRVTDGGVDVVRNGVANASTTDPGQVTRAAETTATSAGGGLPPGLVFFLGGVSVLLVVTALWYWSR